MAFNKRTTSSFNFDRSPESFTVFEPPSKPKAKARAALPSSPFIKDLIRLGGAGAILSTLNVRPVEAFTPSTSPPQSPTVTTFLTAAAPPQEATKAESVNATTTPPTPPTPTASYLGGIVVYQKDDNSWMTKCWNDQGFQVDCATWTGYHYTWNSQGLPISPTNGISSAPPRSDARSLRRSLVIVMALVIILGFLPTAAAASVQTTHPTSPTPPTMSTETIASALPPNNLPLASWSILVNLNEAASIEGFGLVVFGGLVTSFFSSIMRRPVKGCLTMNDPLLVSKTSEFNEAVIPTEPPRIHLHDTSTIRDPPTNLRIQPLVSLLSVQKSPPRTTHLTTATIRGALVGFNDPQRPQITTVIPDFSYCKLSLLLQLNVATENLKIAGTVTLCDCNGVCSSSQEARPNEDLPTGVGPFHLQTLLLIIAMTLGFAILRVPPSHSPTSTPCIMSSTIGDCDDELENQKGVRIPAPMAIILPPASKVSAGSQGPRLSPLSKLVLFLTVLAVFFQYFPQTDANSSTADIHNATTCEIISEPANLTEKLVIAGPGGGIITVTSGSSRARPPTFLKGWSRCAVPFTFVVLVLWLSFSPTAAGLTQTVTATITNPVTGARETMQTYSNTYTILGYATSEGNKPKVPRIVGALSKAKILTIVAVTLLALSCLPLCAAQHQNQNQPRLLPVAPSTSSVATPEARTISPTVTTNFIAPTYVSQASCSMSDPICGSTTVSGGETLLVACTPVCGGSVTQKGAGARGYQILSGCFLGGVVMVILIGVSCVVWMW